MLGDYDIFNNYGGPIGKFLETGWGTFTSFATGAAIVGSAILRRPHTQTKADVPSFTDEPVFCSLEKAFTLSGESDETQFLTKLTRLCGLGKVVVFGKKHVTRVNREEIPPADWATYRLHSWYGGCAIPETGGDDFLDAIAITNLHEPPGPDERVAGWCDLRFKTEEIIRQVRDSRDERGR